MITDKRLQELIDMHDCYKDIMEGSNDVLKSEYADLASSLLELQVLRKAIKQQGSILDSREELIIKLLEDGERLYAELEVQDRISKSNDGEFDGGSMFVDKVLDQHKALMDKLNE